MTIHRAPLEPTSDRVPCCGTLLVDLNPVTDPVLAALVDSVRGPRRAPLIARLREIKAQRKSMPEAANALLEAAGLNPRFDETDDDVPHGEPGHQCIPPEVLMQVQDSLGNVLRIVQGHKQTLEDAGYPEPVVYGMISNLHAVLLQRML